MDILQKEQVACYHCGDDCVDEEIHFDDKAFCCYGCKAVYELIESSDMHQYYENQDLKAGKVEDQLAVERKFSFLELDEVSQNLIRYQDDIKSLVRFYISGIHCSSCIYLLEHLPRLNSRILNAEVNFIRKEVTITYDHREATLKDLAVFLSRLGYPPTIHLDSLDESKKRVANNSSAGIKIAVAGFCFGNSMLISLPEYLDVGYQLDGSFRSLFGWINLVLALPVVFYAARDYFVSSWKGLRHRYLNIDVPISLGVLTLFTRSTVEILAQTGPGYVDSLTGLVFFLLVGKWYQSKTYQALSFDRDYTSYFPVSVTRLLNGKEETVMLKDLAEGDAICIHNQELIPADGLIIRGAGNIDYSFVTGEADPVGRNVGEQVFAGGRQIGGELVVSLNKAVNNSELTQLWNSKSFAKDANKYDGLIDRVSKYFTITIILLAIGTATYWFFVEPAIVWDSVTAVLIIACPCALALTLPFAFGHAMRVLGSRGIYLKNANIIESVARVKEVIFDKTGTLTKNDPMKIRYHGVSLGKDEKSMVRTVTGNSAHPLSKLIASHLDDKVEKLPVTGFDEVIGKGIEANVAGAILKIGSANFLGINAPSELHESQVHVMVNERYKGYYAIGADYRSGIFDMLRNLRKSLTLHLLSGDNESEAPRLSPYFSEMAFRQKPKQKLEYITRVKGPALMIGDGLNDAGALKSAEVGFAVCEDIHQFSPACDAMVAADSVIRVPQILQFAKRVIRIVIAAFMLSFAYNVIGLSFAVSGNLTPVISAVLMPISSVTVVGFITLAVNLAGRKYFRKNKTS